MRKSDISYQEKLNELRLDISHPNSNGLNFILLEGDTDIRLFRKFFDLEKCKVENVPGGNVKLEECVQTLVNIYPLIIGIRDADFIRLSGEEYSIENMFLTDFHDIEITMLNYEPVLNSLVFEYTNLSKDKHKKFRDDLIQSITLVGYTKLLNALENLELTFTAGFQDLISFANLTIDFDQYIGRILAKSPNARITSKATLIEKVIALRQNNPDLLQLTNGHDLLNTFAKYFRDIEGRNGTSGDTLATSIRMIFNSEAFTFTNLFSSLLEWQETKETQLF